MKKLLRYGWPVLAVGLFQVLLVNVIPTPPARRGWIRLGVFILIDVGIGVRQWISYRQARAFVRRIADLFEGRCTCDLYWAEFPCSIHEAKSNERGRAMPPGQAGPAQYRGRR
jgi:hypothetical protein